MKVLESQDVAERVGHGRQGGVVLLVGEGGVAVGDEEHLVVQHHRVPRGGLAADLGGGAGDDQGVDAAILQDRVQVGRAGREGAEAALAHLQILRPHIQARATARGPRIRG